MDYPLSLTYVCMDDYNTSCQCNKFPVSNIIIDGFLDQPLTICKALDGFNDWCHKSFFLMKLYKM